MPNKTIYVRDADVPIFERAQEDLGESVSSLFAEFLHERLTNLTEDEKKVLELIKQIRADRKALKAEGAGAAYLDDYEEAEAYARQVLEYLRKKDFEAARNLWFGAKHCHHRANGDAKVHKKISREIDNLLGG